MRITMYSTAIAAHHGRNIVRAKARKSRPELFMARRFVRFDTGSNNDAVLAR
ncbi:hypothetical protein A9A89_0006 [Bifidobacterium psychraerophilum DSM 22366]|nr:hypothetical protein [Bifidobacterium psychraerophilum]PKA93836.1 hypothetical protein A9A89_0006 [Bifidobacterium psychraerophilum DSM 22366]